MIRGLSPISAKGAQLLILGSMPSERSLKMRQYYAHPQNAFWKIMMRVLGQANSYREKTKLLKKHKIALWDVIQTCERKGSLDTAIKNPEYNDIKSFLRKHPKIKRVLLNGGTAHTSYLRYAKGKINLPHKRLPSTSPANTMKFKLKLKAWKKALIHAAPATEAFAARIKYCVPRGRGLVYFLGHCSMLISYEIWQLVQPYIIEKRVSS